VSGRIKRRKVTLTTGVDGATGTAAGLISLGAPYAKVLGFEFKGDDANVDTNNTLKLTDADGRIIFAATALDGGTDDGTVKLTSQDFSTVGLRKMLTVAEADVIDQAGDASADTEGVVAPPIAKSPVTVNIAAGTDGDVHEVSLFVEL
jgi:hypothetical protein